MFIHFVLVVVLVIERPIASNSVWLKMTMDPNRVLNEVFQSV